MTSPTELASHSGAYIKLLYLRNLTSRICLSPSSFGAAHGDAKESPTSRDQVDLQA
jgi:hypothetical protein